MSNIQNRLNELKPYIIGLRFQDNIPLVDTILKEGWVIPKSDIIGNLKGEDANYYMFFSDTQGIDEILDFIEKTINLNNEREKKQILFKEKQKELQEFFKKHTLSELLTMKFELSDPQFIESDLSNDIHNENINESFTTSITMETSNPTPEFTEKNLVIESTEQLKEVFSEKANIRENMTEEEREEEEAIARAESYRNNKDKFKLGTHKKEEKVVTKHGNINLPPKNNLTCDCGDGLDKICDICMERKSF